MLGNLRSQGIAMGMANAVIGATALAWGFLFLLTMPSIIRFLVSKYSKVGRGGRGHYTKKWALFGYRSLTEIRRTKLVQSYSNLLELMKARHSVRSYDPRPVEKEKLDYIVEAFRVAPSAKNIQPWHLVIVSEKNTIDKLVEACYAQSFVGQAPVVVAVVGDERIAYGRLGDFTSSLLVDIGIAFEHLVLAAWEQGLGTCWIGKFKEPEVRNILGVPEGLRVIALTPLGYPSPSFVAKDRGRKSPNEIVHYEKF